MSRGGYKQINKTLNVCAFEEYLDTQQSRLPSLDDVKQLSPRVIRVLGQNPGKVSEPSPLHEITGSPQLLVHAAGNNTRTLLVLGRETYH
jgi:hypothetical protein